MYRCDDHVHHVTSGPTIAIRKEHFGNIIRQRPNHVHTDDYRNIEDVYNILVTIIISQDLVRQLSRQCPIMVIDRKHSPILNIVQCLQMWPSFKQNIDKEPWMNDVRTECNDITLLYRCWPYSRQNIHVMFGNTVCLNDIDDCSDQNRNTDQCCKHK